MIYVGGNDHGAHRHLITNQLPVSVFQAARLYAHLFLIFPAARNASATFPVACARRFFTPFVESISARPVGTFVVDCLQLCRDDGHCCSCVPRAPGVMFPRNEPIARYPDYICLGKFDASGEQITSEMRSTRLSISSAMTASTEICACVPNRRGGPVRFRTFRILQECLLPTP